MVSFSEITKIVLMIGTTVEYNFGAFDHMVASATAMYRSHYTLLVVIFVAEFLFFLKKENSNKIRIFVLIDYIYFYFLFTATIGTFWMLILGVIFLSCYTIYGKKKIIYAVSVLVNIVNIIAVIKHLSANNYITNTHMLSQYVVEIIIMIVFTLILINSSDIVRKMNSNRIMMASKEEERANELAQHIITIGEKVKSGVDSTNLVINELDYAMNTTSEMLKAIVNGNYNNGMSIKEQIDISKKIAEMMNDVVNEVNKTVTVVEDSLKEVEDVKASFDTIKNTSNNIVNNNKEVINVIDHFVENTKNVKETTKEIAELIETNTVVNQNTKNALEVNENNKEKVKNTVQIMSELLEVVSELDKYVVE